MTTMDNKDSKPVSRLPALPHNPNLPVRQDLGGVDGLPMGIVLIGMLIFAVLMMVVAPLLLGKW